MTHKQIFFLISFLLIGGGVWGQLTLPAGTSYVQDFDGIGSGLSSGWSVRTGANSSSRGSSTTFFNDVGTNRWTSTTGAFTNMASSDGLTESANNTDQDNSTDRLIGVRQTGSFGDPGVAFELEITSTTGKENFDLTIKHQMLNVQSRSTTWSVQYSTNGGSSWSTAGTYSDPGVWGSTEVTYDLGSSLDNIGTVVYLRVVALSGSSGSGTRDTYGIDDFELSWENIPPCTPPSTQATNFGTTNIDPTQMDVTWTRGNGANILVVARQGGPVNADPVNSTTYTANAAFGSGDEIGTGNYVVYNGTGTSATITALTANTTYHYALYEFDGTVGNECYRTSDKLTGSASTAPVNDDCTGATLLTVDTDETCDGATSGYSTNGTLSLAGIDCGGFTGNADDDVWYSFVAAQTSHIITVNGAANMDAVVDLRSGACNGTNIACADETSSDGTEVITATGLTMGATYYVRVYDFDAGGGDFTICVTTPAQPLHYRSKASGNFSNSKTWEKSTTNMGPWSNATKAPDVNDLSITIQGGFTVTLSSGVTIDQLTVESGSTLDITGGTLVIADGAGDDFTISGIVKNGSSIAASGNIVVTSTGTYQHNVSSTNGTIPNATWSTNSVCEILQSGGTGRPDGLSQNFHDFIWNFSTQTTEANLNGELDNIAGDFHVMHTGSSNLRMVGSENTTTIGGDLIIDATAILNLSGSGSNGIIQVSGNCTINGTLTELGTSDDSRIEFVGTGNGSISVGGSIQNQVNLVLNRTSGGGLTLGTNVSHSADGILTLTNGKINTNGNILTLLNTATESISGGSSASYINGTLRQYITTIAYSWPIGNTGTYAPVSIDISTSGATYIEASYDPDNFMVDEGETTCTDPPATDYTYTNNCGSWLITPNVGGASNYSISLIDAKNCGLTTYTIAKDGVITDCPTGLNAEFTSWSRFDLLGGPAGVLPVELTQFNATLIDQKVNLTWATASEINNDYFQIQHSNDGSRFDDLGTVTGAGTTTQSQSYTWLHEHPAAGVNYYRLKQVDFDGQFEYSPVRAVMMDGEATKGSWTIRPTVTSDMIYLIHTGPDAGAGDWTVLTPEGRTVLRGTVQENAEQTPVSVATLTGGMYILRISSRDGVWSGRFQKD